MGAADIRVDIIQKILTKKMKKKEVKEALAALETEFGENAYTDDGFSPKEKPWSEEYYLELKKMSLAGVSSKKYILHLVEVRDYLKFKLTATIVGVVVGLIVIVVISTWIR